MVRRALLLPPLAAVVLALAACGSGSGGDSGTLTKAQYDAKLNRLCLVSSDQLRELHLTNTIAAYRHDATSIVRIDREFLRQLAKLKPPLLIAGAAAAYAQESAKSAQDDKNAVAAATKGDNAKLRAAIAQQIADALAALPYAKTMGATGCYIG